MAFAALADMQHIAWSLAGKPLHDLTDMSLKHIMSTSQGNFF